MDFSLCSSLFLSAPEGIRTPRHLASENYDKPVQTNVEA